MSVINYEVSAISCSCPNIFQPVKAVNSQQAFVSGGCGQTGRFVFRLILVHSTIIPLAQHLRMKGLFFSPHKEKEWDHTCIERRSPQGEGLSVFPCCFSLLPTQMTGIQFAWCCYAHPVIVKWLECSFWHPRHLNYSFHFSILDKMADNCAERCFWLVSLIPLWGYLSELQTTPLEF